KQIVKWATLVGRPHLLLQDPTSSNVCSINLNTFVYSDFLEFIIWTVRNRTSIQTGTLSGYRSAIKSLYRDQQIALPIDYGEDLKEFYSGLKKSFANDLQSGKLQDSGKRPLNWSLFLRLGEASLSLDDSGFTHLFLIVTWNLMCRSQLPQIEPYLLS
ncbi:hypothetical protein AC1031_020157, partial [Aphanomyces cochlioides]